MEALQLDLAATRVEVIEEMEPASVGALPFLGSIAMPRTVRFVSIPAGGNAELLLYAPLDGPLLEPLEGVLEEGVLTVKWHMEDVSPLLAYLKDQQELLNRMVERHNQSGVIL